MSLRLTGIYSTLFLTIMGVSLVSHASEKDKLLQAMKKRVVMNKPLGSSFIKSFAKRDVSYIYDQALAIMTFVHAKDQTTAHSLLTTVQKLYHKDGPLHFAYMTEGSSAFDGDEVRVIHGALAWTVMAANYYQKQFQSKEFTPFAKEVLNYLETQKVAALGGEAIQFAQRDLKSTPWDETKVLALEHNVDAYSAFSVYADLNDDKKFKETSIKIKKFISSLWDNQKKHYWSGYLLDKQKINKDEIYLDNQTWTLLAIDDSDISYEDANHALNKACESFYHVAKENKSEIHGFFDRRSVRAPAFDKFVWSEGTAGKLLASKFINPHLEYKCHETTERHFKEAFKLMKSRDGGISYATKTSNIDFTTDSSIAGTAWAYFYHAGLNPFKLTSLKTLGPAPIHKTAGIK